jgi:hypothetical protein
MATTDLVLAYILRRAGIPIEDAGKRVRLKPDKSSKQWRNGGRNPKKKPLSVENKRD